MENEPTRLMGLKLTYWGSPLFLGKFTQPRKILFVVLRLREYILAEDRMGDHSTYCHTFFLVLQKH